MRDWELRVCPNCGRDHCREVGKYQHGLPCGQCGHEMVTLRLVLAPGEKSFLRREQLKAISTRRVAA